MTIKSPAEAIKKKSQSVPTQSSGTAKNGTSYKSAPVLQEALYLPCGISQALCGSKTKPRGDVGKMGPET